MKQLKRVFKVGATKIADPCPTLSLTESVRILCKQYPQFRHTTLFEEDGVVQGDEICYTLALPPVKTNG